MLNQNQHRTDIEKITVLLPYWVNHNNDHIREQEKWLKKAKKEGLIEVADKLTEAIEHSKKANRHIEQAHLGLKDKKTVNRAEILDTGKSQIASQKETPPPDSINFNLKQIGVFASRSPLRPNCLGLSIVRIKRITGNRIVTSGLDVFDGTPLLDIKPYIKELDSKCFQPKPPIPHSSNQSVFSLVTGAYELLRPLIKQSCSHGINRAFCLNKGP